MANGVVTDTVTKSDFDTFKTDIKSDFENFKKEISLDIKTILSDNLEKLEKKIDRQTSGIKYWAIGGAAIFCIVFSWLFDYKFDYTNEQNQARFERIESNLFPFSNMAENLFSTNKDRQNSNIPNLKRKPKTTKSK